MWVCRRAASAVLTLRNTGSLAEPTWAYSSGFSHRSDLSAPPAVSRNSHNRSSFNLQGLHSRAEGTKTTTTQNHKVNKPTGRSLFSKSDIEMSCEPVNRFLKTLVQYLEITTKVWLRLGKICTTNVECLIQDTHVKHISHPHAFSTSARSLVYCTIRTSFFLLHSGVHIL